MDTVKIPVTVKTRLGWDNERNIIVDLAEQLQDRGIEALTIHGRTRAQMYTGEADWSLIGEVKKNPRMQIPLSLIHIYPMIQVFHRYHISTRPAWTYRYGYHGHSQYWS